MVTREPRQLEESGGLGVAVPRWVREAPLLMEYEAFRAVIDRAMARGVDAGLVIAQDSFAAVTRPT